MTCPGAIRYLIEPRFAGGTSAAVAAELRALSGTARIGVSGLYSRMFSGDRVAPVLDAALTDLGLGLEPASATEPIGADLVILHNPAFLKFETKPLPPIACRDLVVVTHENFLRPGGAEGFDVTHCLDQIDRATLSVRKWLAPVSSLNRRTVADWLDRHRGGPWRLTDEDWFNICDFPLIPPTRHPSDRRGRVSRPGREKFPPVAVLDLCFPACATNVLMGAEPLGAVGVERPHWELLPFGSLPVSRFLERIDFFLYFVAPTWRESFGRVIAEAIAAGKLVLTDPETAANFDSGAIGCGPAEVDGIIAGYIADPDAYGRAVRRGQAALARFGAASFRARFERQFSRELRRVA